MAISIITKHQNPKEKGTPLYTKTPTQTHTQTQIQTQTYTRARAPFSSNPPTHQTGFF